MPKREYGVFTTEQAKRVWDATMRVERELRGGKASESVYVPPPIYFRNDSGYTIPPYGCIQKTGTYDEIGGQNYITVERPIQLTSAIIGPFLLNGPREVEDGEFGIAQSGPIFRAITDGTTLTVGTRIGPLASSFEVGKGCLFSYIGADDVETDCCRLIACETPILAKAGGSGISANSSGTVTARVPTSGGWSDGTVTYTAWAPTDSPVSANAQLMLFPVDARWVAVEICP